VIVDELGQQYPGGGNAISPIVIPRARNTNWEGVSTDGSVTITPGDVVPASGDGHAPDLSVNWCEGVVTEPIPSGSLLVQDPSGTDCRPTLLDDPELGQFLGRDPDTGKPAWQSGAVISNGAIPFGVAVEDYGDVPPLGFQLLYGQFVNIADQPGNYARIGFSQTGGVDPADGTFKLPDRRGNLALGRDNMGGTAANRVPGAVTLGLQQGNNDVTIGVTNLPPHSHPGSLVGGSVSGSTSITATGANVSSGGHIHNPGVPTRSFVTVEPPLGQAAISVAGTDDVVIQYGVNIGSGLIQQGNNAATDFTEVLTSSAAIAAQLGASTIITNTLTNNVASQGGGTALEVMNPYTVANYIMRIG